MRCLEFRGEFLMEEEIDKTTQDAMTILIAAGDGSQ